MPTLGLLQACVGGAGPLPSKGHCAGGRTAPVGAAQPDGFAGLRAVGLEESTGFCRDSDGSREEERECWSDRLYRV